MTYFEINTGPNIKATALDAFDKPIAKGTEIIYLYSFFAKIVISASKEVIPTQECKNIKCKIILLLLI